MHAAIARACDPVIPSSTKLRARCALLLGCMALAPGSAGFAQAQPADAWEVGIELGFNAARGNTQLTLFSTTIDVTRTETTLFELSWSARALYGENAGNVVARRYRTGLNFDWRPEARVSPFIFIDAERDRIRKLNLRTNVGGGAKYVLWRGDLTEGSISAAMLHDYERFTTALPDGGTARSTARWSFRAKAKQEFDNGIVVENVTFYKPMFDDLRDHDIDMITKASFKLSDRIAVTASWALRYDATPPLDVRKDDQIFQLGLSLDL